MKTPTLVHCGMALALAGFALQCGSGRGTAERTIFSFVEAVQKENLDALHCLLTGAAPAVEETAGERQARRRVFDDWARSRYSAYLIGRDEGGVEFSDDGIVLTKAFALGKGAYYTVTGFVRRDDTLVVDTEVRFAYADIDISGLPTGTVFYACGSPLGRIRALEIPRAGSVSAELLSTVDVRWTLEHSPESAGCPERWTVSSATALPETVTTSEITWEF